MEAGVPKKEMGEREAKRRGGKEIWRCTIGRGW
jgi:hypothetical protein